MSSQRQIDSITVDIHRLESLENESGLIRKGDRYIVLAGQNLRARERKMPIEHRDLQKKLKTLRYERTATPKQTRKALDDLAAHATYFLPSVKKKRRKKKKVDRPVQIDLVLGSAELWAFPFEACYCNGDWTLANPARDIILTRRIRQGFAAEKRPWPVRPRVLFVHAPAVDDLPKALIAQHVDALEEALRPWSKKGEPQREGLLECELVLDPTDLKRLIREARETDPKKPFTHVHVLAHGRKIEDPEDGSVVWGLRLGDENREASNPEDLAKALEPGDGLPVVVTLAACDSANQADPQIPERSFAQELHKRGIPIVIASQLPITQPGSVTLTRVFYNALLQGEDARWALHVARQALHEYHRGGHDWVSLVGYVQLPEGYSGHLMEVGVQHEMELLKAARGKLDQALDGPGDPNFDQIEKLVRPRIRSLEQRLMLIPKEKKDLRAECQGILASAHKRLAELLFRRSEKAAEPDVQNTFDTSSKDYLRAALGHYRAAFRAHIQNHWLGAQLLSLEAVLDGAFQDPRNWQTTFYAAELALADNEDEFWAYGTLAELWLLAPFLEDTGDHSLCRGGPLNRDIALSQGKAAIDQLVERAQDPFAIPSTRDQIARYTNWWLKGHGFFGEADDLAADAQELLQHLLSIT
ncbi:MAG: CHAT domain-containing protein [bacterium]|nr:CHAT domain-containing protein [bacterium]